MVRLTRLSTKKLGEILLEGGIIDREKLDHALEEQKKSHELVGEVLVRLGHVTEQDIARCLAMQFALPYLNVARYDVNRDVLVRFPAPMLLEHQCIPLDQIGQVVIMAIGGPIDPKVLEQFERVAGTEVHLYVSAASEIERALDKYLTEKETAS